MRELYLSRLTLPLELALHEGYRTTYDWHRFVWLAFPGREKEKRDFLYRVDIKDRMVVLLVQSAVSPTAIGSRVFETKTIPQAFFERTAYRFQVRVNPTYRQSLHGDKPGKRLALYKEEDLRPWFQRKFAAIGCEVLSLELDHLHDELFTKDGKRGKHVAVDARGALKVVDAALFAEGTRAGIGSAKGFGYGLLMLQPVEI